MNYEIFYQNAADLKTKVEDAAKAFSAIQKNITKAVENGDIKAARTGVKALADADRTYGTAIEALAAALNGFDEKTYFSGGEFTEQLKDELKKREIDVTGEAPVLEVFPYKVKIDADNQEVSIDKKRYQSMRPSKVADTIKAGKDKLTKAAFKSGSFADELFEAYDTLILKNGKNKKSKSIYLKDVYKYFTPARFRKDYDEQAFAFDIARLYNMEGETGTSTKGHYYEFGTSREGGKGYRILNSDGKELFVSTVKFDDK